MSKRFRYGEIAFGPSGPALAIHGWGDDHNTLVIGLVLVRLYLNIPRWPNKDYDVDIGFGFTFCDDSLHLYWGKKTKVLWYPWSWTFYKRWELVEGGSYAAGRSWFIETPQGMNHGQIATKHVADYTYTRASGEVQKRTATVYVDLYEHRWLWLKWLPWPRRMSRSISVEFSGEVGERTGSWKGGVLGCGYAQQEGESALDTLRRMERERKFN